MNRYQPIEQAGSGGFASVIVAWDTRIQRKVAIKCMPLELSDSESPEVDGADYVENTYEGSVAWRSPFAQKEAQDAHVRANDAPGAAGGAPSSLLLDEVSSAYRDLPGLEEARMAAKLSDSSIVSVYDFEVQGSMAYLILEYVDGLTLHELLRRHPEKMDEDVVGAIFKAVSHALEVAHKKNVLHLDIKPANVLIDTEGNVKVVDFGLATLMSEAGFGDAAVGGTIGYMPPEQMRREPLDGRCDEWALASLTYEMISGSNPFLANSLGDAEKAIYETEIVLPSLCMDGLDESIDDILFCALDPEREERYDTVKAFAHELQQCLGSAKKGKKKLEEIVQASHEVEHEEVELAPAKKPLFERVESTLVGRIAQHVLGFLTCGLLGALALTNIPFLDGWSNPVTWVVFLLLLALGTVFPRFGSLAVMECFGLALFLHAAPLPGILVMVVGAVWWFFLARYDNWDSICGLAPVVCGAVFLGPFAPLLAGYVLRVKDAFFAALFAFFLAVMLAGLGSLSINAWQPFEFFSIRMWTDVNANLLSVVSNPAVWLSGLSWILSALIMALFCGRQKSSLGILGAVISLFIMMSAAAFGLYVTTGAVNPADFGVCVPPIIATILIALLCVLLPPTRAAVIEADEEIFDDADFE